ncbi:MAG: wax ester/triacylglycerol synthase family O-acyltransferase [Acidobacteriota bacterium]|nr:wax ester/triacylglycerol synthase family O-acyltransferase [Acidobacteriota bacterium]
MERLGGIDAAFLYFETPSMHMHVCGLLVLDTSTMAGGYRFDRIRQMFLERHPLMPAMTRKLVVPPFNLGRPSWVTDPDFDIDYHLRRIAVPSPGGPRELADVAGAIASRPLDRARPLWEMWVVEGLADGNVAIFAKMHHATIDGITGANLMMHLFDLEARPAAPPEIPEAPAAERIPGELELFGRGALETIVRPLDMARLVPGTVVRLAGTLLSAGRRRGQRVAAPFTAPRTSFNAAITPHRTIAFTEVSLEAVKEVKDAFGCKVNDVVTALVSGALRRYLAEGDELPDKSLIAAVPVSVHDQTADAEGTTKLSVMFSSLLTDIEDPVERLRAIAESNAEAKDLYNMVGAETLMQWAEHAAPNTFSLAARLYSSLRLSERHPVLHNMIISNVPGPPIPLYMAGARLLGLFPLGPIMDGAGLNVTVLSNEDRIGFGLIACRELVPRLWDLAEALPHALDELVRAAGGGDAGDNGARSRPAPRRRAPQGAARSSPAASSESVTNRRTAPDQ